MSELATVAQLPDRLSHLERIIERGFATYVEVGQALLEIRDERLYRETFSTFESYCRERWGLKRAHAYRQIEAAQVAAELSPIGDTPANESQARALTPLRDEPEQMAEAWAEASSDGKPTAARVKRAVERRMDVHYSSQTDEWETPQALFDQLDAEFRFELDVCALDTSAKCADYFTPEQDGLAQPWIGACWMNPPYGDAIADWMTKASAEAAKGATVVCLVPARVDTGWWWDNCRQGEIRFLRGRLRFGSSGAGAPFPSAVVVLGPDIEPCVRWWER